MWWLLLLLTLPAWSQDEVETFDEEDLKTLQTLEDEIPSATTTNITPQVTPRPGKQHTPPVVRVELGDIEASGIGFGVISPGKTLIRLKDDKHFKITESITTKYFLKEDELGFKHLVDKNGKTFYKTDSNNVIAINRELELYEPPLRYTPAPKIIVRAEYDKKLNLQPEASFLAGIVQGGYMADLFNDSSAMNGYSTQYGFHYFTQWKLPVKVGAVIHYEKSTYKLTGDGQINYDALSFGPQFKTKDFELFETAWRFQTQFRVSPFAHARADTVAGEETFKFNSADLLTSMEHPFENRFGEFVLGFYFQSQWLNLRSQTRSVNLEPSNATNKSFGLSFAQVFQ